MSTEEAAHYLPSGMGKDMGYGVRKLLLDVEDPLVEKLRIAEQKVRHLHAEVVHLE